ncbi:biotin transporter BioY [Telmatospirillum sp. J64-1]|uniref:biotin transporter BioY n=1 Tax=Telmatospirillum sp. J64-1 TaxID=2502183 RepID=UPI001C8F1E0E|nr:biotin transporter BioY [Telmatospirillum sp. J64-1]
MTTLTASERSVLQMLWPAQGRGAVWTRGLVLALAGSVALWASARLQVPFWPVPMTMQTLVVTMIAATFGWRLGLATVMLYLAQGTVGLPVFAGTPERGIGLAYMVGPTGGYLLGFLAAVAVMAPLAGDGRSWTRMGVAMIAGNAVILLCGFLYLATLVGASQAWAAGVLPFLTGALVKAALGTALMVAGWRLLASWRR